MSIREYRAFSRILQKRPVASERGNVLILIFIVIALFAALGFAVSSIMRSGDPGAVSDHRRGLNVGTILDYTRSIRSVIQNLRISSGCTPEQISFENPVEGGYANSNAPADNSCHVFHISGGGMNYDPPDTTWLDPNQSHRPLYGEWYFIGESCVYDIGTGGTDCASQNGGADSELIVALPYVTQAVCEKLNSVLNISDNTIPRLSDQAWASTAKFTGTYTQGNHAIQSDGNNTSLLQGKMAGCFEGHNRPPTGTYTFYQVLIPR